MENSNGLLPVHPGEILREIVMPEAGMTVTAAAKALGISRQMFHAILGRTQTPVSGDVHEGRQDVLQLSGNVDASAGQL